MKHNTTAAPNAPHNPFQSTATVLVFQAKQNREMLSCRHFFGYVWSTFRKTGVYTLWKSILTYLRGARTVSLILRILSLLFSFLRAGTLVLLSTILLLILLPLTLLSMLLTLLAATLQTKKANRKMKKALSQKKVYVLFLPQKPLPYFKATVQSLAMGEGHAVLLCSPYWISGKGLFRTRAYSTVRKECDRIYLVRRYYFPALKRSVLDHTDFTVIY